MKFDPYRVEEREMEDWDDPRGYFVRGDDFDEMRNWWGDRGKEIDRLYELLGKINELCDTL